MTRFVRIAFLLAGTVPAGWLATSCSKAETPIPNTALSADRIVVSHIADIPADVTFDRIEAAIMGYDWQEIATVEAAFDGKKAVLVLPTQFPSADLMKAVRESPSDYTGFWGGTSDDPEAKVAALGDLFAWDGERRVGRLYLTDWPLEGMTRDKSWIYYLYADRPFAVRGASGSYIYTAVLQTGWNAYANTNLADDAGPGNIHCVSPVAPGLPLRWHFEDQTN